ncbi:uncharacterized protein LOC142497347 isoform X2 [Ascaphus truei]|uniref:uncharacterized protein LOC142497347 isoform X2 n=1 Tax=Ascaphus truei TaxID=8439 RepID=UPI003F591896
MTSLWNLGCCHRDIKIKPRQLQLASERRQTSGCIKQIMMDPTTLGSSEHTSCVTDIIKNSEGTTMDEEYGQHGKEGRLGVGETTGIMPEIAPVVTSSYETAHNIDLQLEIQTTSTHEDYPVKIIEEKQTSDDVFEQNKTSQEGDSLTEQKMGYSMENMNVESTRNDNVEELEKIEQKVDFKGLETGSSEEVPTNKEAQITCCPPNDTDSIADTIGFVVPGEWGVEKPLVPTSREDHCYSYAMGGLYPDIKQKKRIHRVKKAVNDRFTDTMEVSELQPSTKKVIPIIFQEEAKDDGSDCDKTSKVSHLGMSQYSCTDTFYKGLLSEDMLTSLHNDDSNTDDIFEQNTTSQEDESLTEQKMGHSMEDINMESMRNDNVEELKKIEHRVDFKRLETRSSEEVQTNKEAQKTYCPPNDTNSIADTIEFVVPGEWGVEKPLVPTSREDHCYSYAMGGLDPNLKQKRIHRMTKAVNDRFTDTVEASDLQPSTKEVLPTIFQEEAKDDGSDCDKTTSVSHLRMSQHSYTDTLYKGLLSEDILTSLHNDDKNTDDVFEQNRTSQEEDYLTEQKMGHLMEDMNVESTRDDNVEELKQIEQKVDFKGLETGSSEEVPTNKEAQITYCPPKDTDSIADTIGFIVPGEWGVEKPLASTSKNHQCCSYVIGGLDPKLKPKKKRQKAKKAVNERFTYKVEVSDLQPSAKDALPIIFQEEDKEDGTDDDKTIKVLQSQRSCTDAVYNALLSEPMLDSLHDDNNTDYIFEQNKTSQEEDSLVEQKMSLSMENMTVESTRDDNVEELKQIEQKVNFKGLETGSSEEVPINKEAQITYCPPMDTDIIADTIEFVISEKWGVEKPLALTNRKDQCCSYAMGGLDPNLKPKKKRQRVKKAVKNKVTYNVEVSDIQPSAKEVLPIILQEEAKDDGNDKTTKVFQSQRSCTDAVYNALFSEPMLASLHDDNNTDYIFEQNKTSQEGDSLTEQKMGHSMENMTVESTRDDNVEELKQVEQKVDFKGLETGSPEDVPTNKEAQKTCCPPMDTDSIADTIEFVIKGECCPGEMGGSGPNRKEKKRRQRVKKAVNNRFTDNVEASDLQPSRKEVIPMIFQEETEDDGSVGDKTTSVSQLRRSQRSCKGARYKALLSEGMLASLHDDNKTGKPNSKRLRSSVEKDTWETVLGGPGLNRKIKSHEDVAPGLAQLEEKCESNHHTEQCSVISDQEDLAILKRKKAKYNGSVQKQQSKRGSQAQNAKRSNKIKGSVQNRSYRNESNNNKTMERDVRNADVDFWNMPALWVLPRWTSACLRIDPQGEAESGYEAAERAGQRAFLEHAEAARGRRGTELRSYRKRSTSQCELSIRLTKLRRLEKQPPTPLPEHFYCPVTFQRQHISALKLHDVTCHLPAEDLMHCSYKDFRERMLGIYSGNASETPVLHIIPAEEEQTSTENQSLDRSTS